MTDTKYTPGRWEAKAMPYGFDLLSNSGWLFEMHDNRVDEDEPFEFKDEQEANARLIASAPDLLDALRDAAEHIEGVTGARPGSDSECIVIAARQAIAKAEGKL